MRKAVLLMVVLVCAVILGIPLWVFKGYSPGPDRELTGKPQVRFFNVNTGKVITLPLEEYLVGVVAAEMPAEFEVEALKAQAVAARTYTVKRMLGFGGKPSDLHPDGEICNNPTHCQAWIDDREMKNRWGILKYPVYKNKIIQAVKDTRSQVITFNNTVIEPVYHGSCGGRGTENSEDVWSEPIPYLRSVECPQEYKVSDHVYVVTTGMEGLLSRLRAVGVQPSPAAMSEAKPGFTALETSAGGRVIQARVFGQVITGKSLREALGLTSTLIRWEQSGDNVTVESIGKGHAVGMCQYGANGMALAGNDYKAIIFHYYTGVKIQKIK